MNTGKETWKWGVVVILLAVFLITANQAYQHIANQETFEPPDDYLKGDSWDLEHQNGPGAGQPMQMPKDGNISQTPSNPSEKINIDGNNSSMEPITIDDDIDWNQSDAEWKQNNSSDSKTTQAKETLKIDNKAKTEKIDNSDYNIFTDSTSNNNKASLESTSTNTNSSPTVELSSDNTEKQEVKPDIEKELNIPTEQKNINEIVTPVASSSSQP